MNDLLVCMKYYIYYSEINYDNHSDFHLITSIHVTKPSVFTLPYPLTQIIFDILWYPYNTKSWYTPSFEAIVTNVKSLYGLCKAVPEDWDYIGRAEDIVAGKYTYN